ncbi:hypothetical protein BDZ89DRAFT_369959 [Hymenopellis radicata]|nr:hypothetical protein BDZ89DRAFT_369959 [Hymenopellis radicata]
MRAWRGFHVAPPPRCSTASDLMMDVATDVLAGPPPDIPIVMLTGPHLVGMFLNWFLIGILSVQMYLFFLSFSYNNRYIKIYVYGLYLLEWAQTILMTYDAFHWFVFGWGNRAALMDVSTKWMNVPLMGGIISASVQLFFSWQIYQLTRSPWVAGVTAVIAFSQGTIGVVAGIRVRIALALIKTRSMFILTVATHSGEAVADIIIAVTMAYILFNMKSGFRATDRRLVNIMRLFIETGILTSTVALLDIVFFVIFPAGTLHECPGVILPKLYSNTLLALLNNRIFMPDGDSRTVNTSGGLSSSIGNLSVAKNMSRRSTLPEFRVDMRTIEEEDIPLQDIQGNDSSNLDFDGSKHPYAGRDDTIKG